MEINPKIFRAYDIRGIYPAEINERTCYELGRIFSSYLNKFGNSEKNKAIVVGRDFRLSSDSLANAFIDGVLNSGFDVFDIGECMTPMQYFATTKLAVAGGAMITASHNPSEYNGIKFAKTDGQPIGGAEIKDFYRDLDFLKTGAKGTYRQVDISAKHLDAMTRDFKINRPLRVVIDASGGAASPFLPDFLKRLGVDYIPLFFEPDGAFLKHSPNPSLAEAQIFVKEKIKETGADFGVIFDGDADRLAVIDENSAYLRGDVIGGIIADAILKRGDLMLHDLISTRALCDYFTEKGNEVGITRVGDLFVKKAMREKDAVFAFECSGHYCFKSFYYTESSFYALRLLFEVLNKNYDKKISELAKPFLKYYGSGIIILPLSQIFEWGSVLNLLKDSYKDGKRDFGDGISVYYPNWWFNVRLSNTEPVAYLSIEANTPELLEEKKKEILEKIKSP